MIFSLGGNFISARDDYEDIFPLLQGGNLVDSIGIRLHYFGANWFGATLKFLSASAKVIAGTSSNRGSKRAKDITSPVKRPIGGRNNPDTGSLGKDNIFVKTLSAFIPYLPPF